MARVVKMVEVQCENPKCGQTFMARKADRNRGWARCCCKACAGVLRIMESPKENMFAQKDEPKPKFTPPNWNTDSDGGGWD